MGPTGTGKSSLAMHIAAAGNSAIVCCDSMQIYQKLDIGTAKASIEEQSRVPHFMLDCCELPDSFSAARWSSGAMAFIRQENESGRIPLIVGGTGLYLRALTEGLSDIPPEQPGVREKFKGIGDAHGTAALYEILQEKDAAMADPMPVECPVFVLDAPRDTLRHTIGQRFHDMLDHGWLEEVAWLHSLNLPDTHPAMRAVGYRQLLTHVRGECSLPEAIDAGIMATRRYAKRQRTWFTHQTPDAVWGNADQLAPRIIEALNT